MKPPSTPYPKPEFVMRLGTVDVSGDEPVDLLQALIDDYPTEENQRLAARLGHAVDARLRLTARLLADNRGPAPTAEQLETLTGSAWQGPEISVWRCSVSLVLLDVWYEPFTSLPRPSGSIVWLRPSRELSYLRSLAETGEIELAQRQ